MGQSRSQMIQFWGMYSMIFNSDWLGNSRSTPFGGPPLKSANGAAAGGNPRISKSGVDTNETIHTIMFSSHGLTQVLQLFTTSSYPRRPHHQLSHTVTISRFLIAITRLRTRSAAVRHWRDLGLSAYE